MQTWSSRIQIMPLTAQITYLTEANSKFCVGIFYQNSLIYIKSHGLILILSNAQLEILCPWVRFVLLSNGAIPLKKYLFCNL